MKLKPKPNVYDVVWSYKKAPDQWGSFRVNENELQITIMQVMSNKEWQLECVAIVATVHPNKYELPLPD